MPLLGAVPGDVKNLKPTEEKTEDTTRHRVKEAAVNLPVGEDRRKLVKYWVVS